MTVRSRADSDRAHTQPRGERDTLSAQVGRFQWSTGRAHVDLLMYKRVRGRGPFVELFDKFRDALVELLE